MTVYLIRDIMLCTCSLWNQYCSANTCTRCRVTVADK